MNSSALILTISMTALCGCASSYDPGSLKALQAETRQELMKQCMSAHTGNIRTNPEYFFRSCSRQVDSRVKFAGATR